MVNNKVDGKNNNVAGAGAVGFTHADIKARGVYEAEMEYDMAAASVVARNTTAEPDFSTEFAACLFTRRMQRATAKAKLIVAEHVEKERVEIAGRLDSMSDSDLADAGSAATSAASAATTTKRMMAALTECTDASDESDDDGACA